MSNKPLCPECQAEEPLRDAIELLCPLDARSAEEAARHKAKAKANAGIAAPKVVRSGKWFPQIKADAASLKELRVYVCSGAPCPNGQGPMQPISIDLEPSCHFCSVGCAEARLKTSLLPPKESDMAPRCRYVVGPSWPGVKLRGTKHETITAAIAALRKQIQSATGGASRPQSSWEGLPLYGPPHFPERPLSERSRVEAHPSTSSTPNELKRLSKFPADAYDGAFYAHLDAAGGTRPYGLHWPYAIGSKLSAVMEELRRIRSGEADKWLAEQLNAAPAPAPAPAATAAPAPEPEPEPAPADAVSSSAAGSSAAGVELVGRRVRVWWTSDEVWYSGSVVSYSSRRGHRVEYDKVEGEDDAAEWIQLENETWELLDGGAAAPNHAESPPAPMQVDAGGKRESDSAAESDGSGSARKKAKAATPATVPAPAPPPPAPAPPPPVPLPPPPPRDGPPKVVVFCGSARGKSQVSGAPLPSPLCVLAEALTREMGAHAWARIEGDDTHDARSEALRRFQHEKECFALLLPVKACSSGLTLTAANHVILIDLQSDHRAELQLINRVHRIGQTRPVLISRFVSAGTVEERMLELRKKTKGVLAAEGDATAASLDSNAAPAPAPAAKGGKAAGKKPAGTSRGACAREEAEARLEDVRYLVGLAPED